jgi:type II secretory pathway pseudopilin PulG
MQQHKQAQFPEASACGEAQRGQLLTWAVETPRMSALRVDSWLVLTWRDLLVATNALATHLRQSGFASGNTLLLSGDLTATAILLTLASRVLGGSVGVVRQGDLNGALRAAGLAQSRFAYAAGRAAILAWQDLAAGNGLGSLATAPFTLIIDQPALVPDGTPGLTLRVLPPLADLVTRPSASSDRCASGSLPATSYWLEETSNDLIKVTSLIDFWLGAGIALSLPIASNAPPVSKSSGSLATTYRQTMRSREESGNLGQGQRQIRSRSKAAYLLAP